MRRRLDLAASVVGRPRVLFLEEPTTGLDPHSRNEVWAMVRDLTSDGVTVLLTTQYLEEADQLAHDVAVIDHGKVIATGTPDELKAKVGGQILEVQPVDSAQLDLAATLIAQWIGVTPTTDHAHGALTAPVPDGHTMPGIIRSLDEAGVVLAEFALRRSSLDEVFLALTGLRGDSGDSGDSRDSGDSGDSENEPRHELDAHREKERARA